MNKTQIALTFLNKRLAPGAAIPIKQIKAEASAKGITEASLDFARRLSNITTLSTKDGWAWKINRD
jgi:hypothetical protein